MATKTKGEIAELAAKQLGVSTRTKSATPEEIQDIIDYMDIFAASINGQGIRIGYDFTSQDPNQESGIPNWAERGFYASVAIEMCPYFEKQPSPSLIKAQAAGMNTILNQTIEQQRVQYPSRMPVGTGSRFNTYGPRYYRSPDRISTDNDFLKDEGGEVITTGGS